MIEILLAVLVAAFIVYAVFSTVYMISLKRSSDSLKEFIKNSEGNVNATLSEIRATVENMRKISGDVREVTADIRQISHTVAGLEQDARGFFEYLNKTVASAAEANIAGVKAGVTAGVATLIHKAATRKE
jgi:uncharacterized protein YoxC